MDRGDHKYGTGPVQRLLQRGLLVHRSPIVGRGHSAWGLRRFAWKLGGALEEHEGRCDKIPDVFLAKIGQELSYRCQKIEWSCDNGDFRFSWRDLRIRINDKGHLTFVE